MEDKSKYVDSIYHFSGEWDIPSLCGLKIIAGTFRTLVIVTEFYDRNPGTSVTNWNTHLAREICAAHHIDPEKMIFVEHTPGTSSRLSFYGETFDRVTFDWNGSSFSNPRWKRISGEELDRLINSLTQT